MLATWNHLWATGDRAGADAFAAAAFDERREREILANLPSRAAPDRPILAGAPRFAAVLAEARTLISGVPAQRHRLRELPLVPGRRRCARAVRALSRGRDRQACGDQRDRPVRPAARDDRRHPLDGRRAPPAAVRRLVRRGRLPRPRAVRGRPGAAAHGRGLPRLRPHARPGGRRPGPGTPPARGGSPARSRPVCARIGTATCTCGSAAPTAARRAPARCACAAGASRSGAAPTTLDGGEDATVPVRVDARTRRSLARGGVGFALRIERDGGSTARGRRARAPLSPGRGRAGTSHSPVTSARGRRWRA